MMLLEVRDLAVRFGEGAGAVHALDGVCLGLEPRGRLGIVGETGSGKTTLARAMMGLLSRQEMMGSIRLGGQELLNGRKGSWDGVRWQRIALTFAGSAFNPVLTVGEQIEEPLLVHGGYTRRAARRRVLGLLERVELEESVLGRYPHELSGGQRQRAMIAMALACAPEVLILDEPTAGLDTLTRARLLETLDRLCDEEGVSLVMISHDISAVSALAQEVAVLYQGMVMEQGPTEVVLADPRHPYTWGLLNSYPTMTTTRDLGGIRGTPPPAGGPPVGCPFAGRCTQALSLCAQERPRLERNADRLLACHRGGLLPLLEVSGLRKAYGGARGGQPEVEALRGVDLVVREGETVALVGESGSGKSTLARAALRLLEADGGRVLLEGEDLLAMPTTQLKRARRRAQLIFQDPREALSPRLPVKDLVREPLDVHRLGAAQQRAALVRQTLRQVGLPDDEGFLNRRTDQLSGGQCQRVAIARALVLDPKLLVADEPTSMLDASEQARVMRLLRRLQNERGMGMLLISHDLALVRKVADRIYVMREGRIVEEGPAHRVVTSPQDAYTAALVEAAPRLVMGFATEAQRHGG
jgi:peptide/nickel transport system ATP-binding protein